MSITMQRPTEPATLMEVAGRLDQAAKAIRAIEAEGAQDEAETLEALELRRRERKARIQEHNAAAEGLIAAQQRLMAPFASIFGPTAKPRGGTRQRGQRAGGPPPANIVARERNRKIRDWNAGLDSPYELKPGEPIPAEVIRAYEQSAEYAG